MHFMGNEAFPQKHVPYYRKSIGILSKGLRHKLHVVFPSQRHKLHVKCATNCTWISYRNPQACVEISQDRFQLLGQDRRS